MSGPLSSSPSVEHAADGHCYRVKLDGAVAHLDYIDVEGRRIFTHTFTPPELRGRGLAELLVRAALEDARRNRLVVVPQCSYVARFIERHREFADLVAADG